MIPGWLILALSEIGNAEGRNHERIAEYKKMGTCAGTPDTVPWCADFMNWIMITSGNKGTGLSNARSFLTWGKPIDAPALGCVCVFSRGSDKAEGHVALYLDSHDGLIYCLGGNQGNRVGINAYDKKNLLGYRWTA